MIGQTFFVCLIKRQSRRKSIEAEGAALRCHPPFAFHIKDGLFYVYAMLQNVRSFGEGEVGEGVRGGGLLRVGGEEEKKPHQLGKN